MTLFTQGWREASEVLGHNCIMRHQPVVHKIAYTLSGPLDLEGMGQSAPTSSF